MSAARGATGQIVSPGRQFRTWKLARHRKKYQKSWQTWFRFSRNPDVMEIEGEI